MTRRAGSGGACVRRTLLVAAVALAASLPFVRHAALVRDDVALLAPPMPGALEAFGEDAWRGRAASSGLYRPVARAADSLVAGAGGGARAQKGTSALLHAAAAVASLGVAAAAGLSPPAALAAALLFAAHPAFGEVFGEVAGRAEILAALFSFSFLLLLALRRPTRSASLLAIALALVAALSKESAAALPAIAFLFPAPDRRERFRRLALAAAGVGLALAARALVLGSIRGLDPATVPLVDNPVAGLPFLEGRRFALAILAEAAALLAFPVRLSADWSYGSIAAPASIVDARVVAGLVLVAAAAGAALVTVRTNRAAAFGGAAALVAFLPASQLVLSTGALFGERFLYAPAAYAAMAVAPLFARSRAGTAALAGVVALFLARAAAHSADFASNAALYRAADRDRPGGARPPAAIAHELRLAGDRAGALAEVERALAVLPEYATAISLRATLLAETGRPAEAAAEFRRVALSREGGFEAWWNCARALRDAGDRAGAADAFREAMRADPRESERCERAIRSLSR